MASNTQVTKISITRKGDAHIKMRVKRKGIEVTGAVLRFRNEHVDIEYPVSIATKKSGTWILIDAKISFSSLRFEETYWDIFVMAKDSGNDVELPCKCIKSLRGKLALSNVKYVFPDGMIVFPYIARGSMLAFLYRKATKADTALTRIKEVLAYAIWKCTRPYWKKRDIQLVFEKFSYRAQDNGFYFFQYCMDNAPEPDRKRTFYVIDKDSPDYKRVQHYGRQVVDFMSFRHMLYALGAELYIGSDSSQHLYAWRTRTSIIRHEMNTRPIFFLQHGVMALKRCEDIFGIVGLRPMTYFLTSSSVEQQIIVDNFGYAKENVPVAGLARWDVLEDRRGEVPRTILIMPTWRSWLEGMREEDFVESGYFKSYLSLIENEELLERAQTENIVIKLYIHPKFHEYLSAFDITHPNIELASEGERPLNELIMECSMLVTDYSSVCWDVLYMRKPVVFYHFDQDQFLEETGSYIDLDNDLPGEVCKDESSVVRAIMDCVDASYEMSIAASEKLSRWGLVQDHDNSRRALEFVLSRPAPPPAPAQKGMLRRIGEKLPGPIKRRLVPTVGARANYVAELKSLPLDERAVMLESRHGEAFEGNMYYIARYLLSHDEYEDWQIYIPALKERDRFVRQQIATLPGAQRINVVKYRSKDYLHALATCKYVFNDTSYLHAFYKRPDQVYVNTWHGTPLKHLGRNVASEAVKMGNVHRNLLCADYLLFPNMHTADAMYDSYMMRGQSRATNLLCGYPRNSVFFDEDLRSKTRKRFGLSGKKAWGFLPTYRGLNYNLDTDNIADMRSFLEYFDQHLGDDEIMYVNLHPFMAGLVDCEGLTRVRMFPEGIPSYDFLSALDGLVTDYSSVFFDFACTGRPIVLFTYDIEEYNAERGTYFNVEERSFPSTRKLDEVLPKLREFQPGSYEGEREEFCAYDSADSIKRLLDCVVNGEHSATEAVAMPSRDERKKILVDINGIRSNNVRQTLERYFDDPGLEKNHYYVTFDRTNSDAFGILDDIGSDVDYFSIGGKIPLDAADAEAFAALSKGEIETWEELNSRFAFALKREWQRRFGSAEFDELVMLGLYDRLTAFLFASRDEKSTLVRVRHYCGDLPVRNANKADLKLLEQRSKCKKAPKWLEEAIVPGNVEEAVRCMQVRPTLKVGSDGSLKAKSLIRLKITAPQVLDDMRVCVGDLEVEGTIRRVRPTKDGFERGAHWYWLEYKTTQDDLAHLDESHHVHLVFTHNGQVSADADIFYDMLRRKYRASSGPEVTVDKTGRRARYCQGLDCYLALSIK